MVELFRENKYASVLSGVYQEMLPSTVRRHLGEFHTPYSLADHLLKEINYGQPSSPLSICDPACGCGIFLEAAIKRLLHRGKHTADGILRAVAGFELNPASLMGAWCTYVLNTAHLFRRKHANIRIPIYLVDSLSLPAWHKWNGRLRLLTTISDTKIILKQNVAEIAPLEPTWPLVRDGGRQLSLFENGSKSKKQFHKEDPLPIEAFLLRWRKPEEAYFAMLVNELQEIGRLVPFRYIVGNPAWINWEDLSLDFRTRLTAFVEHYQLVEKKASVGAVKLDLSALSMIVAIDRLLATGGILGFVITQSVLKAEAMSGLRRFQLPDGTQYKPLVAHDFSSVQMFPGASNRTSCLVVLKGTAPTFPVKTVKWRNGFTKTEVTQPKGSGTSYKKVGSMMEKYLFPTSFASIPLGRSLTSPWVAVPQDLVSTMTKIIGNDHSYRPREGVNTGGASSLYWGWVKNDDRNRVLFKNESNAGRIKAPQIEWSPVEPELLYPLIKGRDIHRWTVSIRDSVIFVPHTPQTGMHAIQETPLRKSYSQTWKLITDPEVRKILTNRKALLRWGGTGGHEWYSLFEIGPYTFSPFKVAYRGEVATDLSAAVVTTYNHPVLGEKLIIPDQTIHFIPLSDEDEAYYICGILNSVFVRLLYRCFDYKHPSTFFISALRIPTYSRRDNRHLKIAAISREISMSASKSCNKCDIGKLENRLNGEVAKLYEIDLESAELAWKGFEK
jgi:hypothetical protein